MVFLKKSGNPRQGEMVVCRITKVHPNSAFARILDYDMDGMIHVSEVAKKWVRDIRTFVKEGQFVVCRVMKMEERTISLSIKRVHRDEANRKLGEFKRERRAEKLLEQAAKIQKKTLEQAYQEVGEILEEGFGNLQKSFETAFKNPELLKSKGVPQKWVEALVEIAKKSYIEKTYTVKGMLELVSYSPDGVEVIQKALKRAEDAGFSVTYISAPMYELVGTGKNIRELEQNLETTAGEIVKDIEKSGGEGSFQPEK